MPVTAYGGVANRGPGALMNCPTFLPMGDNFCLIQVVKTRESKESARNKSFRVLCTPISGPRLTVESPLIPRKSIVVNYLTRDLRKFIAKTSPTLLAYSGLRGGQHCRYSWFRCQFPRKIAISIYTCDWRRVEGKIVSLYCIVERHKRQLGPLRSWQETQAATSVHDILNLFGHRNFIFSRESSSMFILLFSGCEVRARKR